jgi:undecaprenyl-diphosphatase
MTIFEAIILGFVQSLTEFLPVSSSAHLIILPKILGWDQQSLTIDLVLHLGTSLALIVYFGKDLWNIITHFCYDVFYNSFKNREIKFSSHTRFGFYLLVGSIPAVLLGLTFGSYIEENVRDLKLVAAFMTIGTFLMAIAEYKVRRRTVFKEVGYFRALLIGFFQSLALFPGVSRSGATISGGILNGLSREDSGRFAFLLALPVILGAAAIQITKDYNLILDNIYPAVAGFLSSFLFGLLALRILMIFLKKGTLIPFIIYRVILIISLLFFTIR